MFGGGEASVGGSMVLPSMDSRNETGGIPGGLPGLAMAPALDFDSDEFSPASP
jgi:hypothetical protein